jgi:hypothetical protein
VDDTVEVMEVVQAPLVPTESTPAPVDPISGLLSGSSFLATRRLLPRYQGRRLDNSDLIESIDWVTAGLAETLTLVESIRDQSTKDGYGPICHHWTEKPAWAGCQRHLDSDLVITVTSEGQIVHYRPALATSLRSVDYEFLMEHPSIVYPYGLVNATSKYMVHVPHLFVDPAERDHVLDLFLLELPKINYPAPSSTWSISGRLVGIRSLPS